MWLQNILYKLLPKKKQDTRDTFTILKHFLQTADKNKDTSDTITILDKFNYLKGITNFIKLCLYIWKYNYEMLWTDMNWVNYSIHRSLYTHDGIRPLLTTSWILHLNYDIKMTVVISGFFFSLFFRQDMSNKTFRKYWCQN